MSSLPELRAERIEKLSRIRSLGIDPYPAVSNRDSAIGVIRDAFETLNGHEATVDGRIFAIREHGPLTFIDIRDETGSIQLYIKSDTLEKLSVEKQTLGFSELRLLDIGDFIEGKGVVTKTKRGELSVELTSLRLLAKSLRPLPDKHDGLKDAETIFRRRYLDLAINPESRALFDRKILFWEAHREFMKNNGFTEVQIPVLELITGGADARPFVTHHNALDQEYYLRISLELNLKRLIGGGYEKVYALGPVFRNEGIDDEHLQEYTMIEWYWAYANYRDNMRLAQECFRYVAQAVYGKTEFTRGEYTFDLAGPWQEIDYVASIKKAFGIDVFTANEEEMQKIIEENGINLAEGAITRARLVDNLWKIIRKTIAGPAFLVGEPKFMSPLAKSSAENSEITERFHIILAGSELANAYSELNDPLDQLERFKEQQTARDAGDEESQMLDIDFVEMLEYGMPPVSGYGHSERLFAFLENLSVREATLFPQMRAKLDDATREIYGL